MALPCSRCKVADRLPGQRNCRACLTTYQRERRARLRLLAGGHDDGTALAGALRQLREDSRNISLEEATKLRTLAQALRDLAMAARIEDERKRAAPKPPPEPAATTRLIEQFRREIGLDGDDGDDGDAVRPHATAD